MQINVIKLQIIQYAKMATWKFNNKIQMKKNDLHLYKVYINELHT